MLRGRWGVHEVFEMAVDTAVRREIQSKEENEIRKRYTGGQSDGADGARLGRAGKLKKKRGCPVL